MNDSNSHRDEYQVASTLFDRGKYKEAFDKYRTLAESGSVTGQVFLGWMYQRGLGVEQDPEAARHWYQKAADTDSPVAQFYLGRLYGIQKKYRDAIEWLEKSASKNYMPAIYRLGRTYDLGEGVNVDKDKAHRLFDQAAKMGHLMAQRQIAIRMIKGHHGISGIPKGLYKLARVLFAGFRLSWSDPDNDRIRW